MRKKFIVLIVFFAGVVSAQPGVDCLTQNLQKVQSINPADGNYSGFNFLDSIAENSRIILLGEHSHIHGSSITSICKTIKYLHEKHGFNSLIVEHNFLVVPVAFDSLHNILSFSYTTTANASRADLITYWYGQKKAKGTRLFGMDISNSGNYIARKLLKERLSELNSNEAYREALSDKIDSIYILSLDTFLVDNLTRLLLLLNETKSIALEAQLDSEFIHLIDYEIAAASFYVLYHKFFVNYYTPGPEPKGKNKDKSYQKHKLNEAARQKAVYVKYEKESAFRDEAMARNIDFLLKKYPYEKVIIWASAFHISKGSESLTGTEHEGLRTMWDYLSDKYDSSYNIAFIANTGMEGIAGPYKKMIDPRDVAPGAKDNLVDNVEPVSEKPAGSLEKTLSGMGIDYCFLNLRGLRSADNCAFSKSFHMTAGYHESLNIEWTKKYDGIFFTDVMKPLDAVIGIDYIKRYVEPARNQAK